VKADRFDPVAVGIPEERPIIGRVKLRRRGAPSSLPPAAMPASQKGIDLGPPLRLEAPVAAKGLFGLWALRMVR
jgi:hypothetical protein